MEPTDLIPLPVPIFQILITLADADSHGYAIMKDVSARTQGQLDMSPGTLYGSIKRMLEDGLIEEVSARPASGDDERRRYYRITAFGRSVASEEMARVTRMLRQARARGLSPSEA